MSEFARSGVLYDEGDGESEQQGGGGSGLDYREKGYVTSVSNSLASSSIQATLQPYTIDSMAIQNVLMYYND